MSPFTSLDYCSSSKSERLDTCLQGSFQLKELYVTGQLIFCLEKPTQDEAPPPSLKRVPCTSKEERLLPQVPTDQSKCCFQQDGGVQLGGPRKHPCYFTDERTRSRVTAIATDSDSI